MLLQSSEQGVQIPLGVQEDFPRSVAWTVKGLAFRIFSFHRCSLLKLISRRACPSHLHLHNHSWTGRFLLTHPEYCRGTVSGVGVKPNKRTIQNISVRKGAIIQRPKPSTWGRALWTFPSCIHSTVRVRYLGLNWFVLNSAKL